MGHYEDPTEIPAPSEEDCPETNPDTGSRFDLWHPDIGWMLHVWLFEENPARIFAPFNPNIP